MLTTIGVVGDDADAGVDVDVIVVPFLLAHCSLTLNMLLEGGVDDPDTVEGDGYVTGVVRIARPPQQLSRCGPPLVEAPKRPLPVLATRPSSPPETLQ